VESIIYKKGILHCCEDAGKNTYPEIKVKNGKDNKNKIQEGNRRVDRGKHLQFRQHIKNDDRRKSDLDDGVDIFISYGSAGSGAQFALEILKNKSLIKQEQQHKSNPGEKHFRTPIKFYQRVPQQEKIGNGYEQYRGKKYDQKVRALKFALHFFQL
jgi:hypothetical protein